MRINFWLENERPLGRPSHRWDSGIRLCLRKYFEDFYFIHRQMFFSLKTFRKLALLPSENRWIKSKSKILRNASHHRQNPSE
jgi:hypothetical protein